MHPVDHEMHCAPAAIVWSNLESITNASEDAVFAFGSITRLVCHNCETQKSTESYMK